MTFGLTYLVIGVVVALGMRRGIAEEPIQPQPTEETPLPKVSLEKHPTTQMAPDTFNPMPKVNLTKSTDHHVNLTKSTDQYADIARKIQASEDISIMDLGDFYNDGSEF